MESDAGSTDSDNEGGTSDNYKENPDRYFSELDELTHHAAKVRLEETKMETTLLEYLPVNERFNMNKEAAILSRWEKRQQDWENIQNNLSKKLGIENRPLMMTTADEFRSRAEEYDLIQAAIPVKDRYAGEAWKLTLRGGGPIRVPIGHIFSGLECEYK
jgi:hypothetical protein